MTVIGNILWFLFGGLIGGLAWVLAGCLWCVTIIGIPVGLQCFGYVILGCLWCVTILGIPIGKQCFKMAKLSLMPFGAAVI